MKKNLKYIVITILLLMALSNSVFSEDNSNLIKVYFNRINVTLNGEPVQSKNILYNGTTYVPLREISEMLGLDVNWNPETSTAELARETLAANDYEIIETVNAKYVGSIEAKPSAKWYHIETSYTNIYFHDDAVRLEWVAVDIDNMIQYLLNFREVEWNNQKVDIYFLSEDHDLKNDRNYYGSAYDLKDASITMSYDIPSTFVDFEQATNSGERIQFLEDPRVTLLHELAHYVNIPEGLSTLDKWMEEGLANYLSYAYEYPEVDSEVYPDFAERKFLDYILTRTDSYDWQKWVDQIYPDFEHVTDEGAKSALEFEGTMKIHYHLLSGRTPMVRYFETSIIEYFLDVHGKEKLIDLYETLHRKEGYIFREEVEAVYGQSIESLESEWREYIGASKLYEKYK